MDNSGLTIRTQNQKHFSQKLYSRHPTFANKDDIIRFIGKSETKKLDELEFSNLEKEVEEGKLNKCLKETRFLWIYRSLL